MSEASSRFTHSSEPDATVRREHTSETFQQTATIDYKSELIRKSIHLCSLSIPVIYFYISKATALFLLLPVSAAFLIIDLARYYHQPTAEWFYRWFGWLLRKREQDQQAKRLNGATNILFGSSLCVLIFPKIIAINAIAILIISDSTSALIGRRFGKHPFLSKSLQGTIAFFVSALLVVLIAPKIGRTTSEYLIWIAGAAMGAMVESLSIAVDDNISIPLSIGLVMWGLYTWLFPGIDLYRLV